MHKPATGIPGQKRITHITRRTIQDFFDLSKLQAIQLIELKLVVGEGKPLAIRNASAEHFQALPLVRRIYLSTCVFGSCRRFHSDENSGARKKCFLLSRMLCGITDDSFYRQFVIRSNQSQRAIFFCFPKYLRPHYRYFFAIVFSLVYESNTPFS